MVGGMGGDKIGKDGNQDNSDEKKQADNRAAVFTEVGPELDKNRAKAGWTTINNFLDGDFGHN
jgi:hypothetical protein